MPIWQLFLNTLPGESPRSRAIALQRISNYHYFLIYCFLWTNICKHLKYCSIQDWKKSQPWLFVAAPKGKFQNCYFLFLVYYKLILVKMWRDQSKTLPRPSVLTVAPENRLNIATPLFTVNVSEMLSIVQLKILIFV